jgi:carbon-monoxide dehydrogenase small subunit
MILGTKALLSTHPAPSVAQIEEALSGNFCRCTGYVKIVKAVLRAGEIMGVPTAPTAQADSSGDAGTAGTEDSHA